MDMITAESEVREVENTVRKLVADKFQTTQETEVLFLGAGKVGPSIELTFDNPIAH